MNRKGEFPLLAEMARMCAHSPKKTTKNVQKCANWECGTSHHRRVRISRFTIEHVVCFVFIK